MSKSPPFQKKKKMGGFRNDIWSVSFQDFGYNCQNEFLKNTENFNTPFVFRK